MSHKVDRRGTQWRSTTAAASDGRYEAFDTLVYRGSRATVEDAALGTATAQHAMIYLPFYDYRNYLTAKIMRSLRVASREARRDGRHDQTRGSSCKFVINRS